jgi:hypothetical protein
MRDLENNYRESILEKTILDLIAKDLGISPEEVTLESIHRWREENLYPHGQTDLNTKYGGYNSRGRRRILSHVELQEQQEKAKEFLEWLRKKS